MSKLTRSPSKLVGGPVLSAGKNFPAIPNVRVGSVQKVTFLSPKLAACADSAPTLDERYDLARQMRRSPFAMSPAYDVVVHSGVLAYSATV